MNSRVMWLYAALAAIVAGPALAGGAGGSAQVRVHSTTNSSVKVIVQTRKQDGSASVQVFDRDGAGLVEEGNSPGGAAKVTWLGVSTETSSDEVRAQLSLDPGVGLTVFGVVPESPAAKAGLQNHDILVRFGDQILMDPDQLRNLVRAKKAGDSATLTYRRKGKEASATVTLAERDERESDGPQVINLGDFSLDVQKIIGSMPQPGSPASGSIFHFSTNWSFGSGGGGGAGSGGNVITFGGVDNGGCDPAEVVKSLKLDDAKIRQIVEDALKAASQAQQPDKQR
jgi:membrane-associated protease RseP (regulator of RpoE activity)